MTELEVIILSQVKKSIGEVIVKTLSDYNSPMKKLVEDVFEGEREKVTVIMKSVLSELTDSEEFRKVIQEEFNRKVAKFLVGSLQGQVEKAVNVIKQDPTIKSRMILALERIIEDEV